MILADIGDNAALLILAALIVLFFLIVNLLDHRERIAKIKYGRNESAESTTNRPTD